jgi:hypothetical protein
MANYLFINKILLNALKAKVVYFYSNTTATIGVTSAVSTVLFINYCVHIFFIAIISFIISTATFIIVNFLP